MSCVAEAKAVKARMVSTSETLWGTFNASATRPSVTAPISWNSTTSSFLLGTASRNGLHSGLTAQARPNVLVQRVMSVFAMPRSLNNRAAIAITTKNGTPCAKYSVGTHVIGERLSVVFAIAGSGAAPAINTFSLCTGSLFPGGEGAR
jgi:hypothetical protein